MVKASRIMGWICRQISILRPGLATHQLLSKAILIQLTFFAPFYYDSLFKNAQRRKLGTSLPHLTNYFPRFMIFEMAEVDTPTRLATSANGTP
jgi:hypothetical protein